MKALMILLCLVFAIGINSAQAQDAMPTKEETVNYIHKKLQEVVGLERDDLCLPRCPRKFTAFSFVLKGDKIEFEYRFDETRDGRVRKEGVIAVFSPAHMISGDAAVYPCTGGGKSICLKFPDRLVKRLEHSNVANYGPEPADDDTVHIPLDVRIPELKNRLTKALKHLRDLAKAEDDPFSN